MTHRLIKTPTKRKQASFKPQKNTLDCYFHSPKKSPDDSKLTADEAFDNQQNENAVPSEKRRKCTNDLRLNMTSVDELCLIKPVPVTFPAHSKKNHKCRVEYTDSTSVYDDGEVVFVGQIKKNCSNKENDEIPVSSGIQNDENRSVIKTSKRIKRCVEDRISSIKNESNMAGNLVSISDSLVIDTVNTPEQSTNSNRVKSEQISPYFSQPKQDSEANNYSQTTPTCSTETRKISAKAFKDIIYSFCYSDFFEPYQKLANLDLPECSDLAKCKKKHEGKTPKEVNVFCHGKLFNLLDNPLPTWMCDVYSVVSTLLNPKQYLSGDIFRILFDYIMNGPCEDLMCEVKDILNSHWNLHPPCSDCMREVYIQLLDKPYPHESYFKTDLNQIGVLHHVMNQLEKFYRSAEPVNLKEIPEKEEDNDLEVENVDSSQPIFTYEMLEERWTNFQPLVDAEQKEVMDNWFDLAGVSSEEDDLETLTEPQKLERLALTVEIIVNLLEADFLICISRLKGYMKEECTVKEPIIKHFMDDCFRSRVFKYYVKTTEKQIWSQLSRLIGVMAETTHLFTFHATRQWKYPNLHKECEKFASHLFDEITKGGWDGQESWVRLQALSPPWLQHQVSLAVANTHLNLVLESGLQAVVDIIHTHVISPIKLEKDLEKLKHDQEMANQLSPKILMKSKKKNQFGETLLHMLCKNNKRSVMDILNVLALPHTDVNAKDNFGWTPLHEAVATGSLIKSKILLQYDYPPEKKPIDIGAQNCEGLTPLHDAVDRNYLDICQLLVESGGICLLRKKDCKGVTPLMLARGNEIISKYFAKVIKTQEELNLNANSFLKLDDHLIYLCMLVCDAYIEDNHTWEMYQVMRFDKEYNKAQPVPWIAESNKDTLLKFRNDQDHFRKLRRILEKLAENPENSLLVRLWNSKFQYVED